LCFCFHPCYGFARSRYEAQAQNRCKPPPPPLFFLSSSILASRSSLELGRSSATHQGATTAQRRGLAGHCDGEHHATGRACSCRPSPPVYSGSTHDAGGRVAPICVDFLCFYKDLLMLMYRRGSE
jgi:hypothetical protein